MNLLYKICLVLIISMIFFFSEMRVGGDGTSLIVEVNASKLQFGAVIWRLVIWKMMNWVTFFFFFFIIIIFFRFAKFWVLVQ